MTHRASSTWFRLPAAGAVALFLAPELVSAHLSIIRQGPESAETASPDDALGKAVASGDFDGDGYEDLASGAPDESNGNIETAVHGVVIVSYGSAFGLTHTDADVISVGDLGTEDGRFGATLVAADFDNDGFDDLAVGAPSLEVGLIEDAGEVWIFEGGPGGLQFAPSGILHQGSVSGAAVEAFDLFGWSVAAGKLNNDVYADLVVGAIGEDDDAGAIFYFFGSPSGLLSAGAGWMKQSTLGGTNDPNSWFAFSLAVGNFNGIGPEDIAIGAPRKTVNGLTNSGRVHIVFSSVSGPTPALAQSYDTTSLANSPQSDAYFGWALTAGHFYQTSGAHDLVIGEPQNDAFGPIVDAGRIILLEFEPVIPTKAGDAPRVSDLIAVRQLRQGINQYTDSAEAGDQYGYSLATGRGTVNGYDDLAVGVPFEDMDLGDVGQPLNAGMAHLYKGQPAGPSYSNALDLSCQSQNDQTQGGENFGWAVAFGAFDATNRPNLAVGTPGKDYTMYDGGSTVFDAGAVYVVAPWRQPTNRPHRGSVAIDCDQNIVYSQRPFQRLRPASTTKTMTLLLACEAIEAGQDPNEVYTVPYWVSSLVGGSQVPLFYQEQMTLLDLMKTMMTVSGNDAAFAIGDLLTGGGHTWDGYDNTLPEFNALMAQKAAALDMADTDLTNAAGLDVTNHYTTPLDFTRLSYAAMQNECVRLIVGTSPWLVDRDLPGYLLGWLGVGPVKTSFSNGFVTGIQAQVAGANGIKGGSTPGALKTGLWSSTAVGGEVIATAFGVRKDDQPTEGVAGDCLTCTGAELLQLAKGECSGIFLLPQPPLPTPYGLLQGVSTQNGSRHGIVVATAGSNEAVREPEVLVEFLRENLSSPSVSLRTALVTNSSAEIGPGATLTVGVEPYQSTAGAQLVNRGTQPASLVVTLTNPTSILNFVLAPGDSAVIPAASGAPAPSYRMSIENASSSLPALLDIEERGYLFALQLYDGIAGPKTAAMTLTRSQDRSGTVQEMENGLGRNVSVFVVGRDATSGNTVAVSLRAPSVPVDVEEPPVLAAPPGAVRLHPNVPNPFNPSTLLSYEVPVESKVSLRIFDLAGRLVRVLENGVLRGAGRYSSMWNGMDGSGRRAASGVYVVRLDAAGQTASRRIVLLK